MRYLDIAFAFLWDLTIVHALFDPDGLGGAILIVGGCLVAIMSKGKHPGHAIKRMLGCGN